VFRLERVQIDPAHGTADFPGNVRVLIHGRRSQFGRAAAIQHEVRMAGGRAVGDHAHRQAGCVGRVILDLDVEHGGQATEALGTAAERVHLVHDLQTPLLDPVLRTTLAQFVDIDRVHQRFLGQYCRLRGGATDADTEHARRAPAGTHDRYGVYHPVDDGIGRV